MIATYQRRLRAVCLDLELEPAHLASLGADAWRWRTYRRLVRARFHDVIGHHFERLAAAVGVDVFRRLVDEFLAEQGSRSAYLRDVPGEFLAFLEGRLASAPNETKLPSFAIDLARFEWAEVEVACAPDRSEAGEVVELGMNLPAVLTLAHRLLRLEHTVHRIGSEGDTSAVVPETVWLCVYREPLTHVVRTLELTPVTGVLLEEMALGLRPLADVVLAVAERVGVKLGVVWVDALSGVLADLLERGVLIGSRVPTSFVTSCFVARTPSVE